jgi:hypothetical protein
MRFRLLIAACALAPGLAAGQRATQWRFGATASAPTRLLNVDDITFPDSNTSRVNLGVGFGAEAARAWSMRPRAFASVFVRLTTASVQSNTGGTSWSPGRAFIAELGGRVQREISDRMGLFAGAAGAHWSGPKETAPFSGIGSLLLSTEGGLTVRPATGTWHFDFTANLTRFGSDEPRGISTGFVLRLMMGLRRDY